jgi:hypothetical protein
VIWNPTYFHRDSWLEQHRQDAGTLPTVVWGTFHWWNNTTWLCMFEAISVSRSWWQKSPSVLKELINMDLNGLMSSWVPIPSTNPGYPYPVPILGTHTQYQSWVPIPSTNPGYTFKDRKVSHLDLARRRFWQPRFEIGIGRMQTKW